MLINTEYKVDKIDKSKIKSGMVAKTQVFTVVLLRVVHFACDSASCWGL